MFETINPRQTVLITTRYEDNILGKDVLKDNVTAIDWHMPTSVEPPLYAISLKKDQYSAELIRKSRCFVVNFVSFEMKAKVAKIGVQVYGKHRDKFKEAGLEKEDSDSVDCCRVKDALTWLECGLVNEFSTGSNVIFVGKVQGVVHNKVGKKLFHIEGDRFTTTED
ncbi:flavin reductase family protein [Candidatus Woesearchaeota archaeon]|nr:flavin reductase family protein [Candidatus Woesearchaeota archaeon]